MNSCGLVGGGVISRQLWFNGFQPPGGRGGGGGDGSSGSIPGIYGISAYGLSLFFRWSFEYTSFVWHF